MTPPVLAAQILTGLVSGKALHNAPFGITLADRGEDQEHAEVNRELAVLACDLAEALVAEIDRRREKREAELVAAATEPAPPAPKDSTRTDDPFENHPAYR